ncbi:Glycine cleavage T protein (Aminomethyl transferase) [Mesorhizobium metallidurans STM 2683]|uniref:Glycine cleavage T protein (Aminomethyl transferase) n=1 Tax=Mesorhizobium metallidurans STM 2683 TaxID=1297569 RepID=M5FAK8_9HYPH|nr:aminomethyltransferase family protein [Mesorhizobium metallidurans]CCV08941.1 Glycine cleavage T protein (Aminomethyl transferase) [Mesorhizobium metallidurans STM 2683]
MSQSPYPAVAAGPPRPSLILRPGQIALPPGMERYTIQGNEAVLIEVEAGDTITVRNVEGGQACELLACDKTGVTDPGIFGEKSNSNAAGIKALLAEGDDSLASVRRGLERRQVRLDHARAVRVFGSVTPAGTEQGFTVARDGAMLIAAPGGPMLVDGHDTATPLSVIVRRATIRPAAKSQLGDPLADPVLDLRVHSATAESYFVKAGDYLQIIDVDGRQCTDFQCFSARKLDKGRDHPLDVTTTRTLMGSSYPMPGLHSKYYDQDMEPLVEVVQDTCGRHDAFALACAAKYYDDIGYPGHTNCSENFNKALSDKGVTPRAGWMAINFFFNTAIDAHGVMVSDEPWSRPGDYVLLRALTDIVCVSSACPDDTTPANGWNLTDIHVRTYSGQHKFSRAIARRMTPDSEPKMTRETAFHSSFAKHTRNFVEYRGYWLANSFAKEGPIAEYWACRQDAVIMDLSPLRKFEVTGPDSEALLQYTLTRDVKKLGVGQVVYSAMCYEHGGMIDDGTLLRLGKDNFRWVGGDDLSGEWLRETATKLGGLNVLVRSSTDQMHNVAVQGPKSRDILREVIWTSPLQPSIDELEWFRFAVARIGGGNGIPVVVSRTGYTGELGYEVWCHPRDAEKVFDAIWEAGQPHGLKPMGLQALDMVRIEAGLIFAGYEFSDQTDPFEAGIGFTVPLKTKTDDFIGREALIRRKEHPQTKLVGLDIDANAAVGHGDCVHVGRAQIGVVTSGMRSPVLNKNIALARLDVTHAATGTEVEIGKLDGHAKRLPARVVGFAHYDPQKTRPRS